VTIELTPRDEQSVAARRQAWPLTAASGIIPGHYMPFGGASASTLYHSKRRSFSRVAWVTAQSAPSVPYDLAVEWGGESWAVWDRPTGIYGWGQTLTAAIADFRQAVHEHLDVLERQEALSDDLRWQLRYLHDRANR
jgi:hypothetical protein